MILCWPPEFFYFPSNWKCLQEAVYCAVFGFPHSARMKSWILGLLDML